jgi:hypothetical protein
VKASCRELAWDSTISLAESPSNNTPRPLVTNTPTIIDARIDASSRPIAIALAS